VTVGLLPARLELRRVAPGQYEAPELPGVGIVRVADGSWAVTCRGESIAVGGICDFPSLTMAHGRLADARDAALAARRSRP
jgi:hypothetical protein